MNPGCNRWSRLPGINLFPRLQEKCKAARSVPHAFLLAYFNILMASEMVFSIASFP